MCGYLKIHGLTEVRLQELVGSFVEADAGNADDSYQIVACIYLVSYGV